MIIKNFINGQITTGTEPIDPISGVSRGLYINSVLSGNSSSDTLVGLDINPSYSGIAGNYFGLRVSGDTIFATSGGTQVFRTNNSGVAITGTLSNTTGAQFATSSGNVLIGTTTDAGYKLDVNGTGRFSGGIFQSMGTSSLNLLVAGTTSQTSDRGVFVGNGSFNNASVVGVALGYGLTLGTGTGNVAIGYTASASGGGIAISSTGLGASASGGGIAVGGGSSSTGGVAIGGTTNTSGAVGIKGSATAVNAVAINGTASGNYSLSIGDRCTASHTQSIAIGLGSKTSAVGDFVAGGYFPNGGYGIYNVYFGTGPQGDQTNEINGDSYAINGSGGFGTNKNGGNLTLAGGKGTGNGTPGDVIISTATSGSTGSTLQTLTTRLVVKANTGNVGIGTSSPTNPLDIAFSPGRLISFQAVPGYADSGQIVFSNATSAGIVSSGTIGLGPGDTNKTVTLGNGIISKITTPGSTKYDCYGNQTPSTLAGTTNRPVLFTSTIADGCIDGFIFENTSSGSKNLFKVIQDNTTLLTLNPNGNFFLGTTTDLGFKLSVSGSTLLRGSGTTSASYALATQNSSGGTTMVVNNAGNMLIGTTTDAGYRLDVNGTTRLGNLTLANGGILLGDVGGTRVFNTAGLAIDYGALYPFSITGSGTITITPAGILTLKGVTHTYSATETYVVQKTTHIGHLQINFDISGSDAAAYNYGTISGNVRIYPGEQSNGNGYGNVILAHNGINERGSVLIGTSTTNNSRLLVGGTVSGATLSTTRAVHINPTLLATGNTTTLIGLDIQPRYSIGSYTGLTQIALRVSGGTQIIGSGSTGTTLSLFSVDGASGRLFDVTDDFTNSLFSVNTSSGVPVIEAFANNSIVMGTYGSNALVVSGTSIGIGKTSPLYKLDVNGDINVSERLLIESYSSATTQTTSVISATTTNSGIVISPNGTGAITVVVPDGTSVGGNSRGTYSIDLQRNRLLATSVASGSYSSIIGGYNNSSTGDYSVSFGKDSNSYLYGQQSFSSGYYASVGDTQHSTVSLRGVGTGGTNFSFYLTLDGTSSGNYLTPSGDNRTWGVKVLYTAACVQPGVGNSYVKGDSSMGEYVVLLRKSGGTTSIIDTSGGIKVSSSLFIDDKLTFDVGSNQDLRILYTAPSANVVGNVIRAVAKLTLIEIGY